MAISDIDKTHAYYVKIRMASQKFSQSQLSRITGIRQDRISRIVRGESRISLRDFVKLCEVLDPELIRKYRAHMNKTLSEHLILCNLQAARKMLRIGNDGSFSDGILPSLEELAAFKERYPETTFSIARSDDHLRLAVGKRPTSAELTYYKADGGFFQCESRVAKAHSSKRLSRPCC